MEERGIKVLAADKTFFSKITNSITKMLIPTKVGFNNIMISIRRNSLLKSYYNFIEINETEDTTKKENTSKKYEEAYALYLESIDKFIIDSVYKKVKNNTATNFEKEALSKYYLIVKLKDTQYLEYKYKKQKYLLEIDKETIDISAKDKLIDKHSTFYIDKMDSLYKGILKNYSIQLADNLNSNSDKKDLIYNKIFDMLEEYSANILSLKVKEYATKEEYKEIVKSFEEYESFSIGKLDEKDKIEKKMLLLGISRVLFTHSLPLIVAEQCYEKLIEEVRNLLIKNNTTKKQDKTFELLITVLEDYNVKILSTKVYWDKPQEREEYKEFWDKFTKLEKTDKAEFERQKKILFIKFDLKTLNNKKQNKNIISIYKNKLVELKAMKSFKNKCKTFKVMSKKTQKEIFKDKENVKTSKTKTKKAKKV